MRNSGFVVFALVAALFSGAVPARAAEKAVTQLTWLGHAAFRIVTPKGKTLWIDPFLKNPMNPAAADGKDPLEGLKGDFIFITHGHSDHVGEAPTLARKTKAMLVSNFELGKVLSGKLGYPRDLMSLETQMNIGGTVQLAGGELTVTMTPSVHSSGVDLIDGEVAYGGNPGGFVIAIKDGPAIYHSGDTAYFSDIKLIGKDLKPDVALINAGGHFGMEWEQAARAAKDTGAAVVVPHHYKTFPVLTQDISGFAKALGARARVMKPGETLTFEGKKLKK